jgi:hypothetical protein
MFNPLGFASSSVLQADSAISSCQCQCQCTGSVTVSVTIYFDVAMSLNLS